MLDDVRNNSHKEEDNDAGCVHLSDHHIHLEQYTPLYECAQDLSQLFAFEDLTEAIPRLAAKLVQADSSLIRLLEFTSLAVGASFQLTPVELDMLRDSVASVVREQTIGKGIPFLLKSTSSVPPELEGFCSLFGSMMCVPLKIGDWVMGSIEVYRKKKDRFAPGDFLTVQELRVLMDFALFASLAIDRSVIYKKETKQERLTYQAGKRLETLFNSLKSAVLTIKRDYTITSANRMLEQWVLGSYRRFVGRNCKEVFHFQGALCPHCVAEEAFASGDAATRTVTAGDHHLEITAYPIKESENLSAEEINECIIIIRDVTDRINQEIEIRELYKKGTQTKDRLESLIENSADAIVTLDLDGKVTSWNRSAERIFGYTVNEALGLNNTFLPDLEAKTGWQYPSLIKKGETFKGIETDAKHKSGSTVPLSITVSPIKNTNGELSGLSIIARDISHRKSIENELVKSNEKLSRLFFISSAMRGTLQLNKLLRMILTVVTMGDGLGFNRAILFLYDEAKMVLKGTMGVGPASYNEAWRVWHDLSWERKTLTDIIDEIDRGQSDTTSFLDKLSANIEIPMDEPCILTKSLKEKKAINVREAKNEPLDSARIIQQLGTESYAVVPLVTHDQVVGVLWADNLFNKRPITDEDMEFLSTFADQAATAIESAGLFEQVTMAENELEKIFESISDLVYITDNDFKLIKVNKAVCDLIGKPMPELIGKKCYDVFHNREGARQACPHPMVVDREKASITEIQGFFHKNLKETFSVSTSPILDPYGALVGTVHIVSNITEMKKLREQLAKIEKVAALGEMAARVAHEIRNPLVSIGGFARRLEKRLQPPLSDYAQIIVKEVCRLEALLKQTLGFVRESKIAKEVVDVNALFLTVIHSMQGSFKEKVGIDCHFTSETLEIEGDPNRLMEVFSNLIQNAEQSIESAGRIMVRTRKEFNSAIIEVEDTGAGIKEDELKHVFDPFFTTKTTGSGLGLTIIQKVVEELKGTIEVKSKVGVGTIFKINLLLKKEDKHEAVNS